MAMHSPDPDVVCRRHHDWETAGDVSMTVIEAVADVTDSELIELPPLYEEIDPDALDNIFTKNAADSQVEGSVSFEFAGHPVTVHSSGEIVVYSA